ncbi:hypothetical protein [Frankia canadensis]|uniref:hypothetical protein n=1 Tax=Frankia canadensis TaxID=1836972 RepID=UPI0014039E4A|nr:hypothetical protein [Frankia canadensis]
MAIAFTNLHRTFFGERAEIALDGEPAHTSCVAFGLERWLHVLGGRFAGDWDAAHAAVTSFDSPGSAP